MLYCANCLKMVEFNSTAVSSPTAAVTLDLEGDFDPTRIESKTQVFNVCKECGQHDNLYQSEEQFIAIRERRKQEGEQFKLAIGEGIIFAIVGALVGGVIMLLFKPTEIVGLPNDGGLGAFMWAVFIGGICGGVVGFFGSNMFPGFVSLLTDWILLNKRGRALLGVAAGCLLAFGCYQSLSESSAEKEQLIAETFVLVKKRNSNYKERPVYELEHYIVRNYSDKQVRMLKSASEKGKPEAEVAYGYYMESQGDYYEAKTLYEEAAEKGSLQAMFRLGVINLEGLGLYKGKGRPEVAVDWFSQSGLNQAEAFVSEREAINKAIKAAKKDDWYN